MSLKTLEDEHAYISSVKRSNWWFAQGRKVMLTAEQVDTLLRAAYRAGFRHGNAEADNAASLFDKIFGNK